MIISLSVVSEAPEDRCGLYFGDVGGMKIHLPEVWEQGVRSSGKKDELSDQSIIIVSLPGHTDGPDIAGI
jgi:hypothetical protein